MSEYLADETSVIEVGTGWTIYLASAWTGGHGSVSSLLAPHTNAAILGFEKLHDRISTITIQLHDKKLSVLNAYKPCHVATCKTLSTALTLWTHTLLPDPHAHICGCRWHERRLTCWWYYHQTTIMAIGKQPHHTLTKWLTCIQRTHCYQWFHETKAIKNCDILWIT